MSYVIKNIICKIMCLYNKWAMIKNCKFYKLHELYSKPDKYTL